MLKSQIEEKLEELKDCEYIKIYTHGENGLKYEYSAIINEPITEFLVIPIYNKQYPYSSIIDIQGA